MVTGKVDMYLRTREMARRRGDHSVVRSVTADLARIGYVEPVRHLVALPDAPSDLHVDGAVGEATAEPVAPVADQEPVQEPTPAEVPAVPAETTVAPPLEKAVPPKPQRQRPAPAKKASNKKKTAGAKASAQTKGSQRW